MEPFFVDNGPILGFASPQYPPEAGSYHAPYLATCVKLRIYRIPQ
jgi:hypothetical protein